jgi:hypothetical protein
LLKSFESDFRATETEYDQRKKKQKSKREQEDQAKEEREAMDQQLVDSFERRKQEHIKAKISLLSEIEIASLKDEFVQNTMGNEMFKRIYQTKGFDHPVIQIQRNKFLAPILLTIEELDILNFTMEGGAK